MGLQLVASRVLAPFFGSSIFVWASLITTFLAAFSTGSFIGAAVSTKPRITQSKVMAGLMITCSGTLLFDSLACYTVCDWLDLRIENLSIKLIASCLLLYFVPVATLSVSRIEAPVDETPVPSLSAPTPICPNPNSAREWRLRAGQAPSAATQHRQPATTPAASASFGKTTRARTRPRGANASHSRWSAVIRLPQIA